MATSTVAITVTAKAKAKAKVKATLTAVIMSLLMCCQFPVVEEEEEEDPTGSELNGLRSGRILAEAPSSWMGKAAMVTETLKFVFSETLGKWPMMDLFFGVRFLSKRQEHQSVASIYASSGCLKLEGPEILDELIHLLNLLNLCIIFSKKSFPVFLEYAGCSQFVVLLQRPKAGLLKPAFTILRDTNSKCHLLIIRGMHSMNDTLTAATGSVVPFHYSVLCQGGAHTLVSGYAHCGMVGAANWVAKSAIPCLLKANSEYPAYSIKIAGNSLGGGIAALLTYILRQNVEFSSSTCIAFAPAACMTWDLAELGKLFVTTIINCADVVPTCSLASLDNLRSEISASSWLTDFWNQCLPLGCLSGSKAICSNSQTVKTPTQSLPDSKNSTATKSASMPSPSLPSSALMAAANLCGSLRVHANPSQCSQTEETDFLSSKRATKEPMHSDEMTDRELKFEFVSEETKTKEGNQYQAVTTNNYLFFPPGRIMHMVVDEQKVGVYETPRHLYGKIRLSPTMIKDHYMPSCKKVMELMIDKLKRDNQKDVSTIHHAVNLSIV